MSAAPRSTNRLAAETSPYLQQHQHNPVDWYAWGPEAFEAARREDKPIFLSVGYSTCYWCHVMERQCFEVDAIAAVMNRHFINVKVDREERPDVDQLYMSAVQIMTRQGGWPMSVWLTPDLKPFYGGTYFPPTDAYGRPGLPTLLESLADAWRERRDEVLKSADEMTRYISQLATGAADKPTEPLSPETVERLILRSAAGYEPRFGGFGDAPKFPRETLLRLLLDWLQTNPEPAAERERVSRMLRHTLEAMANGGIRDQLGGGFHRYSTDAQWLVPHFEIMLYDQAMLAPVYARAAKLFGEPRYATVARGICDFVLREMTADNGAFFTAFDAEVDHREGLNYLWSPTEIEAVLGRADAATFNEVYGGDRGPNFADPHHGSGEADANILFLPGGSSRESEPAIVEMRAKLLAARARRKQPLLDTKIITNWNALMIEALAVVSRELADDHYKTAAMRAADFLLRDHLRVDGTLARTSRDGVLKHEGTLDDYASLALALLELHRLTLDVRWLQQANLISGTMRREFADPAGGFFFTGLSANDLIVRQKTAADSPLPSGNAMAGMALLRLGERDAAGAVVDAFSGQLSSYAESMSAMLELALAVQQEATVSVEPHEQLATDAASPVHLLAQRAGDRRIEATVIIDTGFHLHDTNVDPKLNLHATRMRVVGAYADAVDFIDYPPTTMLALPLGPPLPAYVGTVSIAVTFATRLPDEPIELALAFQACDDFTCHRPTVVTVRV